MTATRTSTRRRGYSILELLVVMAALIILGAFALPTLFGMRGDTRSKAAADMLKARMNEARSKAMEDGTPYRLAVSGDLRRAPLAPDTFAAPRANPTTRDETTATLGREDGL